MRLFSFINNVIGNIKNKPATRLYPAVPRTNFEGARGHLVNDSKTCIYCGICQKRCPSDAITVVREPKTWTLDPYKCIVCGYCLEACPKKCLSMNPSHGRSDARSADGTSAA
jgi:formate hydrogenlyase subunit 6/NADH:ubiquinone oxidoreductase subunit I